MDSTDYGLLRKPFFNADGEDFEDDADGLLHISVDRERHGLKSKK